MAHGPVARRIGARRAAHVDGSPTKTVVDDVHRRHQAAAIPCLRAIEVKLALRHRIGYQIKKHHSSFGELETRLVDLSDAHNGSPDQEPRVRSGSPEWNDSASREAWARPEWRRVGKHQDLTHETGLATEFFCRPTLLTHWCRLLHRLFEWYVLRRI